MRQKLNTTMLDKLEDVIIRFPRRHNQGSWRNKLPGRDANLNGAPARECGTTMCAAGWIAELDRGRWAFPADSELSFLMFARAGEESEHYPYQKGPKNEPLIAVSERARRILGITDSEAYALFNTAGTKPALKKAIKALRKKYASA